MAEDSWERQPLTKGMVVRSLVSLGQELHYYKTISTVLLKLGEKIREAD